MTYIDISMGTNTAAAVRSDGGIVVWGVAGASLTTSVPPLPTGVSYVKVACGAPTMLALRSDGVIVTWGVTGAGVSLIPVPAPGITYTGLSQCDTHAVALRSDGSVVNWGVSDQFQHNIPRAPAGLTYVDVAVGSTHLLALMSNGSILSFGSNTFGESSVPVIPFGVTYTKIDASISHSVALRSDGIVEAWGQNTYAQNIVPSPPPGEVYTDVSTGPLHVLARRSSGAVVGWGYSSTGQTAVPTLPAGVTYATISAGRSCSAAIRSDGTCVTWGSFLPAFTTVPNPSPGTTFVQVSAGQDHAIARLSDGTTIGWGLNTSLQTNIPALRSGMSMLEVDAGFGRSAARVSGGSIIAWGLNSLSQTPAIPGGYTCTRIRSDEGTNAVLINPPPLAGSVLLAGPALVAMGSPWAISLTSNQPSTTYLLDISFAGPWPGIPLATGLTFPLNRPFVYLDYGSALSVVYPGMFSGFIGTTNSTGSASAVLNLPVVPALSGTHFWAAAATLSAIGILGVGGVSNALEATLTPVVPSVSSIAPAAGPAAGGYLLSIHGSNLTANTTVTIGNTTATNMAFLSPNLITCTVPVGAVGPRDVVIHVGTMTITLSAGFTYTQNLSVGSFSPTFASPGTLVTVTGTGLLNNVVLSVGGSPLSFNNANGTSLTFVAPNVPTCAGVLTVSNAGGQTVSAAYGPIPTVVGAFFATGPVAGGSSFTLLGYNFVPGTIVHVGGVPAVISSMTQGSLAVSGGISVVAPPASGPGPRVITVTSPTACTAAPTFNFVYY